jgi:hypothetical protein
MIMRATLLLLAVLFVACGGAIAPDSTQPSGPEPSAPASGAPASGAEPPEAPAAKPNAPTAAAVADGAACGGAAHVPCTDGAFCFTGGCRVIDDQAGTCFRPPSGPCAPGVVPACGCDGNVYSNACEAVRSGVGWSGKFGEDCGG